MTKMLVTYRAQTSAYGEFYKYLYGMLNSCFNNHLQIQINWVYIAWRTGKYNGNPYQIQAEKRTSLEHCVMTSATKYKD